VTCVAQYIFPSPIRPDLIASPSSWLHSDCSVATRRIDRRVGRHASDQRLGAKTARRRTAQCRFEETRGRQSVISRFGRCNLRLAAPVSLERERPAGKPNKNRAKRGHLINFEKRINWGRQGFPGRTHPWHNWIAHRSSEPRVAGSNPAGCTSKNSVIYWLKRVLRYRRQDVRPRSDLTSYCKTPVWRLYGSSHDGTP
jgi:hypothetical protein